MRRSVRTGAALVGGWLVFGTFVAGSVGDDPLSRLAEQQRIRAAAQPNDPRVQNDLGNSLSLAGDAVGAETAYRNAIAADPGGATAHYNLGRLLREQGRGLAARRELKRAIELDPRHAFAWFQLAMVYDDWGFDKIARRDYEKAFRLEPALADPASNPYLADRKRAFAVVLRSWSRDESSSLSPYPAAPGSETVKPAPPPPTELDRPSRAQAAPPETGAPEASGGFARSYGAQARPDEGSAPRERSAGNHPTLQHPSTPAPSRVIDRSALTGGGSVNQVTVPAAGSRSPGRKGSTFGGGAQSAPTRRPFTPAPQTSPFVSAEDSTGRLEIEVQPVDPGAYAFGAGGR